MKHSDDKTKRTVIVYVSLFFLMVIGIVTSGYVSFRNFEQEFRHQAENQISAIAQLKVNELVNWRKERLDDAQFLYHNPAFSVLVERYFETPDDVGARDLLLSQLNHYQGSTQFDRVCLLDTTGAERLSIPSTPVVDAGLAVNAVASLQSGIVSFFDFHYDTSVSGEIHLDILVPIFADKNNNRPLGVLALSINPQTYLYPYIQNWPIPSDTAETLLVRRDGEDALFLNELRFKQDTALTLHYPLRNTDMPAVKAVLGQSGVVEGLDYRGEQVLADVRSIPDSPWFMVSKVDVDEVYAPLRTRLWQTLLIVGMAILVAGFGLALVWRQQRILAYRVKTEAVEVLRASEEKFRKAFFLSPDSININRLQDGMYVSINNGFTKIMGYAPDEVIGKTSLELNIWENPQDRQALVNGLRKNGEVENLETCFRAKNGDIKYGLMSASMLELNGIPHIISITRDITERRQAEEALRESEAKFRALFEQAAVGVAQLDTNTGRFIRINQKYCNILGYTQQEMLDLDFQTITYPDDLAIDLANMQRLIAGETREFSMEKRYYRKDGSMVWVSLTVSPLWAAGELPNSHIAFVEDITTRKQTEEALEKRMIALTVPLENTESITFTDLFNLEDIQRLQDDFSKATGVASVITQVDGTPITVPSNFCRLCNDVIRKTPKGYINCCKSDAALGKLNPKGPRIQPCMSGGLWDAGAGISVGGMHVANWLIGQVRDEAQTEEKMVEYAGIIGVDEQVLLEAFREVPAMSRESFERVANALFTLASQLSSMAYQNVQQARFIAERKQAEDALRESRTLFSSLVESMPQNVFSKDLNGRFIFANQNYCRTEGKSLADILGKTDFDLHPFELAQQYSADDRHMMETKQIVDQVEIYQPLGGEISYVQVVKAPIYDAGGRVKGMLGIFWDVTDRRRTEEMLRITLAKYKTLFEYFPLGITIADGVGRFLETNPIAEKLLGLSQDEQVQRAIDGPEWRIVRLDGTPMPPEEFAATRALKEKRVVENVEMGILKPDNSITWLSVTAAPLPLEEQGIVITYSDITARKQAEEALLESEERFRTYYDNATIGLYRTTPDGRILMLNPAGVRMLGFDSFEEISRRNLEDAGFETSRREFREKIERDGVVIGLESKWTKKDGSIIFARESAKALLDRNGNEIYYDGSFEDVSGRVQAESAFRESEKLYRKMNENSPLGMHFYKLEGEELIFVGANPAADKLLGADNSQFIGKTIEEAFPPLMQTEVPQRYREAAANGTLWSTEQVAYEDGRISGAFEVRAFQTTPQNMVAVFVDITARKRADEALRESEALYRQAIEVANAVPYRQSYYVNGQTVEYDFIGEGIRQITGYGPEEFDTPLWDSITQERFLLEDLAEYSFTEAIERVRLGVNPVWKCEHRIRARDGSIHWVFEAAVELRNQDGVSHGSIGLFQDITARKQAVEALRQSEEMLRLAVSAGRMGVWDRNFLSGQLDWSIECKAMFGLAPESEVNDERFVHALHPEDRMATDLSIREALETRTDFDMEYRVVWPDGTIHWIVAQGRGYYDEAGQVIHMVGITFDITERKQSEEEILKLNTELEQRVRERTAQLETTNKELEAFSYSVSHDLRAPLRGIDGWSQALLEDYHDKLDEQGRQYIDRVRSETQRMGHLIDDMLKLSRLTRSEMIKEQVDFSALAQVIAERLQAANPLRKVDVNIQTGITAECDPHLLEAVLVNLLENAFKFTGKRADARIEFGQTEFKGQRAFFVRDNGAGFDMAYAEKLFGAFQRMHKASEFPGTGVGLAIVNRVIHRHGGRVWAEAEVGRGATFYFTLEEKA